MGKVKVDRFYPFNSFAKQKIKGVVGDEVATGGSIRIR